MAGNDREQLVVKNSKAKDRNILQHPKASHLSKPSPQKPPHKNKNVNLSSVINKLEENYWANWKPKKNPNIPKARNASTITNVSEAPRKKNHKKPTRLVNTEIRKTRNYITEGEEGCFFKTKPPIRPYRPLSNPFDVDDDGFIEHFIRRKQSQEIQTDDYCPSIRVIPQPPRSYDSDEIPSIMIAEISKEDIEEESKTITPKEPEPLQSSEVKTDPAVEIGKELHNDLEELDLTPIKHCDSYILNTIKQAEDCAKEHFEQPKCIRLFKKSSARVTRGGSYPLRPGVKQQEKRPNIRLGRPGSPILVTTSYSHRTKF